MCSWKVLHIIEVAVVQFAQVMLVDTVIVMSEVESSQIIVFLCAAIFHPVYRTSKKATKSKTCISVFLNEFSN